MSGKGILLLSRSCNSQHATSPCSFFFLAMKLTVITTLRLAVYSIVREKLKLYFLVLLLKANEIWGHLFQQCTLHFLTDILFIYFITTASFGAKLYPGKPLSSAHVPYFCCFRFLRCIVFLLF